MPRPIRVTFVEPSLALYRVPFFRMLAARPGICLQLLYAESGRTNAQPDGFSASFASRRIHRILGHPVYWQQAQLAAVDREAADVVSFDWDVHYASLVPALLKAKRTGVATILWGHGTSGNDGSWKAWPRIAMARLADVLVTYSHPARRMYLERGWQCARVFCAPNAIDQTPVDAAYRALRDTAGPDDAVVAASVRPRLGLSSSGPVLLFASRLDPIRRLDVLVDAVSLLSADHQELQVAIVGDGPERDAVRERARSRRVLHRFVFAGAEYDETRLAMWYAAADVVVHPAWLGLSVYHAMGHGRPVVTGDDPRFHPPEAASIEHEETGLRFRHGDAGACAEAINRLLRDASLRHRLGDTARERAHSGHSMTAMVDGFEAAIRAAAGRRR